jgi:ssDNA-binding Zn-finger/Zn-ribbon topoisomerase 1
MKKKNPNTEHHYIFFKEPLIQKYMDVSTGHITKRDNMLLIEACKADTGNPLVAYKYQYGYWIACGSNPDYYKSFKEYGYSENFVAIVARAQEFKCTYVQIDCDGIQYDDLETFDW